MGEGNAEGRGWPNHSLLTGGGGPCVRVETTGSNPEGLLTRRLSFLICSMGPGVVHVSSWRCPGLVVSASSSPQPDSQTLNLREVTRRLGALMPPSELEDWCRLLGQGSPQTELGLPGREDGRLGPQSPPSPTMGGLAFPLGLPALAVLLCLPHSAPGSVSGGHWAPACSFISSWVWGQPVCRAEVGPSYL